MEFETGYAADPEQWPALQDRMIEAMRKLHGVVAPLIPRLREIGAG